MKKIVVAISLVSMLGIGSFGSVKDINVVDTTIKTASVALAGAILVKYAPSLMTDVKKLLK